MWTKVLALVIVLAGCSGTSETGTPATGLGDASAPSDGSAGVDAASAEGAGACADCKALPVAGAADAPTLVSATIKIPSVALPSDDQKIFYEFVITDPQGVADIQNLKIDEFDSPEGQPFQGHGRVGPSDLYRTLSHSNGGRARSALSIAARLGHSAVHAPGEGVRAVR